MSRLLDAEDDDEFYKTTYGGFTEVRVYVTIYYSTNECSQKLSSGEQESPAVADKPHDVYASVA